ncbi:kinase-like domain-containing protein [Globomyces pollinis-pini]|nr:kinase-like domain-containing protein [Globomyces pollinis-pini]
MWGSLYCFIGPKLFEYKLTKSQYSIGRNASNDIVIPDESSFISNFHFTLSEHDGLARLKSTGKCGTYVNGKKETDLPLSTIAEIYIPYKYYFVFVWQDTPLPLVKEQYYIFRHTILGNGSFATVYLAIDINTNTHLACKIINTQRFKLSTKKHSTTSTFSHVEDEIKILRKINHPNIVDIKSVSVEHDTHQVLLFLTFISGGELFDRIAKEGGIDETESLFFFFQLLLAVQYLHQNNICHRDIKAENVLLESTKKFSRIFLTDFGMSKFNVDLMQTKCGTFTYIAPEILDNPNGYSKAVDCWALGVLLYTRLQGELPFGSDSQPQELVNRIRSANLRFDTEIFLNVSSEAKDLISKFLEVDPQVRITVDEALEHPWIAQNRSPLSKLYTKMMSKSLIL